MFIRKGTAVLCRTGLIIDIHLKLCIKLGQSQSTTKTINNLLNSKTIDNKIGNRKQISCAETKQKTKKPFQKSRRRLLLATSITRSLHAKQRTNEARHAHGEHGTI